MDTKIKYIIMCAGKGTRWNNYLGVPKHLIKIDDEILLGRTTRLLRENGITDYIITTHQPELYNPYGTCVPQRDNDCEIDRFDEAYVDGPVCYLYGDVYYTEEALKTIVNTPTDDILYFGSDWEIFAIKVAQVEKFLNEKHKIKNMYLAGEINRCIGWEIYRSFHNLLMEDEYDFDNHKITDDYVRILDETTDFDWPAEYDEWIEKHKNKESV